MSNTLLRKILLNINRSLWFTTNSLLHGRLSSFRGCVSDCQELLGTKWLKVNRFLVVALKPHFNFFFPFQYKIWCFTSDSSERKHCSKFFR